MNLDPEFFGNNEHVHVQRAGYFLWDLMKSNTKLSFYGRGISFHDPEIEEIPVILELAKALKRVAVFPTTSDMVDRIRLDAKEENLDIATGWQSLCATQETIESCKAIVEKGLPDSGYQLLYLSEHTPKETIHEFQSLQQESGVAPVPGYVMRGYLAPCICIAITTPNGKIASTAFAIKYYHPESRLSDWAHIGFLATRQEHRGRGLSKYLLAQVMIDAFEKLESKYLYTGVKPDNVPSQAVCSACGMKNDDWEILFIFDPNFVSSGYTR